MNPSAEKKHIVLAGAGHAHLYAAKHAGRLIDAGYRVTLIDPDRFWYSGLATGMLGGQYPPEQDQVDAQPLIEKAGGTFLKDRIRAINRDARSLTTCSGEIIQYDALSLNIGSTIDDNSIQGSSQFGWRVKPIANLWKLRQRLETHFSEKPGEILDMIVVGGGLTGCEIAANLNHLAKRFNTNANITLLTRSNVLLPGHPDAASAKLVRLFRSWDITLQFNIEIVQIQQNEVISRSGTRCSADEIVLSTGLRANSLITESGLAATDDGSMIVNANLQSVDDPSIFGAGDCIYIEGKPLPKLGVFAVRESPILANNLPAYLQHKTLQEYEPQQRYLSILNLGNGTGLALWGPFYWFGKFSMILKQHLDLSFLKKYRK